MAERTTQERWEKLILHRDTIIQEANLKGAEIPLNADYPEIIAGIQRITLGLQTAEVEALLDQILGEVIAGDYAIKGSAILSEKEAVRQAIIAKEVDVPVETPLSQYPDKIATIAGGVSTPLPVVTFVDYDGLIIKTEEVAIGGSATPPTQYEIYVAVASEKGETPLSEPDWLAAGSQIHDELLIFSKWAGNYQNVTEDEYVGALYNMGLDQDAYLFIKLDESTGLTVKFTVRIGSAVVVTFDFGDGTTEVTDGLVGVKTVTKIYAAYGGYRVKISGLGTSVSNYLGNTASNKLTDVPCIYKAYIGHPSQLYRYSFYTQYRLKSICLSDVASTGKLMGLQQTSSLRCLVIPGSYEFVTGAAGYGVNYSGVRLLILDNVESQASQFATGSYFSDCYNLEYITAVCARFTTGFKNCFKLSRLRFCSVPGIENTQFQFCVGLRDVLLPDSVLSVGQQAFSYCVNLERIDLGAGITSMADKVFWFCHSLKTIIIRNPNAVVAEINYDDPIYYSLASDSGRIGDNYKIYVPDALVSAYEADTWWGIHSGHILPLSQLPE